MGGMRGWKTAAGCVALAALAWCGLGDGAPAPEMPAAWAEMAEPAQGPPAGGARSLAGWSLRPLASYRAAGRVLGIRRYWWSDVHALAPFDLVLGWGAMAGAGAMSSVEIEQEGRWFVPRWTGPPPAGASDMMANIHIIPADGWVAGEMGRLRRGDCVMLEGHLVDATGPAGETWTSSLSRSDTGAGACEVLLVERVVSAR